MSRLDTANSETLRGRLEHALRFDVHHDGSLYLNALAACYLSCPEGSEPVMSLVFDAQAEAEAVDPDEVLNALILAVPT